MVPELSSKPLITQQEIALSVTRLAHAVETHYGSEPYLIVGLMNGAFIFLADLCRQIPRPVELAFLRASSYLHAQTSSGIVSLETPQLPDIKNRKILLVDDILDTGNTLTKVKAHLVAMGAREVKTCVLLDKPSRRQVSCIADFCGMEIEDRFVVGYGLDFAEKYRNLPDIWEVR